MNPFRTFGLAGQLVIALVLLVMFAILVRCAGAPDRARARASADAAALAGVRATSAVHATEAVAARARHDAATDQLSRENADAILAAPGADQPLDPRLNRAGLDGLCLRDAYRDDPGCVLAPGAGRSSPARPRRRDPAGER